MAIVSQVAENEKRETEGTVASFFQKFQIGNLLRRCPAEKQKGASALSVLLYLFCQLFSDRSIHMQLKLNRWVEDFHKDTVYCFLNQGRTNWKQFPTERFAKVVETLRSLIETSQIRTSLTLI